MIGKKKQYVIRSEDRDPEKPSIIRRLAKIAIAITIFGAATYGEGWVNYTALIALFLVYLIAIG
jgi:hypothetical protein